MNNFSRPSLKQILDYEIGSSKWACYLFLPWMHELAGSYYAWKVRRKYTSYLMFESRKFELKNKLLKKEIAMNVNILEQIKKEELCKN